ncbi:MULTISPECIES: hypothetical protein [unclassified Aureispira]|uniref:hypothetical protein n=1 Tax=unclassified Aureispira TaxID=2649989 RepID=UPI0012DBF27D|nr:MULTISPECIES: hypothetical protein [unclassified Aureispira]WMX14077.1 hypothetical protein QP953_24800 [Aureispira sp. CCB-E]
MSTNMTSLTKKYFYAWIFFIFPILLSAQVSTSLNQSFTIDAAQSISIQVNSPNLNIKYIQGSRILVETRVSLAIDNTALLEFIAQKGRYDLIKEIDPNTKCLKLTPRKNENLLVVKGEQLQENVSYTIYIPQHMAYIDLAKK